MDFIVRKSYEYRIVEFERRKKIHIADFDTYIVSIEDLIISKIEWMRDSGSELQKKDVKNLLKTKIDAEYMENWMSKLGLIPVYNAIRNE